ncbi:MAG: flagellar hook-length control protein FliK [Methylococcaceae bacterium]|nr:MAG: flagellar hook-length control protein FliK [Methylococcaceae bacterium]
MRSNWQNPSAETPINPDLPQAARQLNNWHLCCLFPTKHHYLGTAVMGFENLNVTSQFPLLPGMSGAALAPTASDPLLFLQQLASQLRSATAEVKGLPANIQAALADDATDGQTGVAVLKQALAAMQDPAIGKTLPPDGNLPSAIAAVMSGLPPELAALLSGAAPAGEEAVTITAESGTTRDKTLDERGDAAQFVQTNPAELPAAMIAVAAQSVVFTQSVSVTIHEAVGTADLEQGDSVPLETAKKSALSTGASPLWNRTSTTTHWRTQGIDAGDAVEAGSVAPAPAEAAPLKASPNRAENLIAAHAPNLMTASHPVNRSSGEPTTVSGTVAPAEAGKQAPVSTTLAGQERHGITDGNPTQSSPALDTAGTAVPHETPEFLPAAVAAQLQQSESDHPEIHRNGEPATARRSPSAPESAAAGAPNSGTSPTAEPGVAVAQMATRTTQQPDIAAPAQGVATEGKATPATLAQQKPDSFGAAPRQAEQSPERSAPQDSSTPTIVYKTGTAAPTTYAARRMTDESVSGTDSTDQLIGSTLPKPDDAVKNSPPSAAAAPEQNRVAQLPGVDDAVPEKSSAPTATPDGKTTQPTALPAGMEHIPTDADSGTDAPADAKTASTAAAITVSTKPQMQAGDHQPLPVSAKPQTQADDPQPISATATPPPSRENTQPDRSAEASPSRSAPDLKSANSERFPATPAARTGKTAAPLPQSAARQPAEPAAPSPAALNTVKTGTSPAKPAVPEPTGRKDHAGANPTTTGEHRRTMAPLTPSAPPQKTGNAQPVPVDGMHASPRSATTATAQRNNSDYSANPPKADLHSAEGRRAGSPDVQTTAQLNNSGYPTKLPETELPLPEAKRAKSPSVQTAAQRSNANASTNSPETDVRLPDAQTAAQRSHANFPSNRPEAAMHLPEERRIASPGVRAGAQRIGSSPAKTATQRTVPSSEQNSRGFLNGDAILPNTATSPSALQSTTETSTASPANAASPAAVTHQAPLHKSTDHAAALTDGARSLAGSESSLAAPAVPANARKLDPQPELAAAASGMDAPVAGNNESFANTLSAITTPEPGTLSMPATARSDSGNAAQLPAPVATPLGQPGWDREFNDRVVWMAGKSLDSAEIHLNPPHLGPIEVRISLDQDQQASIQFISSHAQVREAIEAAAPRLREMMHNQQLTLVNVNVADSSGQQQFAGRNDGRSPYPQQPAYVRTERDFNGDSNAAIDAPPPARGGGTNQLNLYA